MRELWKDCVEYPELYRISNMGQVFSKRTNKIVKQSISKTGYPTLSTKIGGRAGKSVCFKVHRLVAECFVQNADNKPFVNHKDGNKTNNHYKNLEWCTNSENIQHAYDTGLNISKRGCDSSLSLFSEEQVEFIRNNYKAYCKENGARALGNKFNVNHATISRLVRKIRYN